MTLSIGMLNFCIVISWPGLVDAIFADKRLVRDVSELIMLLLLLNLSLLGNQTTGGTLIRSITACVYFTVVFLTVVRSSHSSQYLIQCSLYFNDRMQLIIKVNQFKTLVLFCIPANSIQLNSKIFIETHTYIHQSYTI